MIAVMFDVLLIASCIYSLLMGGIAEKIGSVLLASAALFSFGAILISQAPYVRIEMAIAAIDLVLFFGLLTLALLADRYWPMWLTSMQLVTIWSHPAFGIASQKIPFAYAVASKIWSFPMLILLAIGTYRYRNRLKLEANPLNRK
jgi:hypothetical protein